MATQYSPKIVTDGLSMCVDAANPKSYIGSGTAWNDLSGTGKNATLNNSPTYSTSNNGALVFNGTTQYGSFGSLTLTSNRSIFAWFKLGALGATSTRVVGFPADDTSTDTPGFAMTIYSDGRTEVGMGGSPYNGYVIQGSAAVNTWIYFGATISGNTLTSYKNAVVGSSATTSGTVSTSVLGYVGRYNSFYGQYLNGSVAMVKMYNRTLTADEVLQNYNATKGRYGL